MASGDWTFCADVLSAGNCARGVTTGVTPPDGGGAFVYAFNSRAVITGAVGLFHNGASFAPHAKGAAIEGAIKRGISGGRTGFSPFFFVCAQGPSVNDQAYMLGLSDDDPYHIVLRKGALAVGCPAVVADQDNGNLIAKSSQTFEWDTWHRLRLEAIKQDNDDVVLNAYAAPLSAVDPLTDPPAWAAIDGISQVVDDALGINTGTLPFTSGRSGYGFACEDAARRGYFDHIALERQT